MKYRPTGVCSKEIEFDLDDQHRIHNVVFTGGCNGNLQGIASLVEGMEADEAIRRLPDFATFSILTTEKYIENTAFGLYFFTSML